MVEQGEPSERAGLITEARRMRALAHPLRWALLEVLGVEGTATAARCADVLDQSQASCSFHLRQLAKYAFVEEAPSADRRERPWRLRSVEQSWSLVQPDPGRELAAAELTRAYVEQEMARVLEWVATAHAHPQAWREVGSPLGMQTWLTPAELAGLRERLVEVMWTYRDRVEHPEQRPPGSQVVRLFAATYPRPFPAGPGTGSRSGPDADVTDGPGADLEHRS